MSGFQINGTNGSLVAVPGAPFATGPVAANDAMATDPAGHFLYAGGDTGLNCSNLCSGGVAEFTIDASNGALTAVAGSPILTGSGFSGAGVDPSGHFLYAADINLNEVFGFVIGGTGALTPVPGSPFPLGGMEPYGVAFHGSGQFVYVADSTSNSISAFRIGPGGTLTAVPGSPFLAGSSQGCSPGRNTIGCGSSVAVTGNFLYYVNSEAGDNASAEMNNVVGFTIDPATGALTPMAGSPFANPGLAPQRLIATPNGKFLYVTNTGTNNVTAYSINPATGALTSVAGSPFSTGRQPEGMSTDPSGRFLYVSNIIDDTVSAFSIGAAGGLTPVQGSPFVTGSTPAGVAAAK